MPRSKAAGRKSKFHQKQKEHKEKGRQAREIHYKDIVKDNELFKKYYKAQNIIPEGDWDLWLERLRMDLPSTFRITGIRGHSEDMLIYLESFIDKIKNKELDLQPQTETEDVKEDEKDAQISLTRIPWYPNFLAWNNNYSRRFIRRSGLLQRLHRFLVEDNECGAITRQEAVSMIPPLFMDIQPHHLVLDTCAAPGSKTAQIIEMMHSKDTAIPTGAVIANDQDHRRCYMLTHQVKRLNSPCVIITNHDASIYPKLYTTNSETGASEPLHFDRVLCDVPCSGDGTIRKNPVLWSKWTPHLGVALHRLQLRIATRGLELLKVGGRLVYSTCSFNPIENEAVIAELLQKAQGSVELVDCSQDLPGLKRQPGIKSWKVFDKKGNEWSSYEKLQEALPPNQGYKKSMFPPDADVVDTLNLQRCMRILPHHQDTGGFFIAVLHKKSGLPWQRKQKELTPGCRYFLPWEDVPDRKKPVAAREGHEPEEENDSLSIEERPSEAEMQNTDAASAEGEPPLKKLKEDASETENKDDAVKAEASETPQNPNNNAKGRGSRKFKRGAFKEDPFIFLTDEDPILSHLRKYYNISMELPSHNFMIRCTEGKKRHIYVLTPSAADIMKHNQELKVINTGVRVISRSSFKAGLTEESGSEYRLCQEGINIVRHYMSARVVPITREDAVLLIKEGETRKENLSMVTKQKLLEYDMGCIVWKYVADPSVANSLTSDLWLCGHHGNNVVQCMLAKDERKHFLRLFQEPIPPSLITQANNSRRDDRDQKEDAVEAVAKQEAESESAAQSKDSKIDEEDTVEPENEDPTSKS